MDKIVKTSGEFEDILYAYGAKLTNHFYFNENDEFFVY